MWYRPGDRVRSISAAGLTLGKCYTVTEEFMWDGKQYLRLRGRRMNYDATDFALDGMMIVSSKELKSASS